MLIANQKPQTLTKAHSGIHKVLTNYLRQNVFWRQHQMNKKYAALAITVALATAGVAPMSAFAATEQPAGNPVVIAGNSQTTVTYAEALAAYNTALAAYNTAAADSAATKATLQPLFNAARTAYNVLARAIMTARAGIDQNFRAAIKAANTAYRAARKAATTAQAKIDADNAFQVAVAAASSIRDAEYAKYPASAMPMPMPAMGMPNKGSKDGMNPGEMGGKKGK
jgi:hypothetical protein